MWGDNTHRQKHPNARSCQGSMRSTTQVFIVLIVAANQNPSKNPTWATWMVLQQQKQLVCFLTVLVALTIFGLGVCVCDQCPAQSWKADGVKASNQIRQKKAIIQNSNKTDWVQGIITTFNSITTTTTTTTTGRTTKRKTIIGNYTDLCTQGRAG